MLKHRRCPCCGYCTIESIDEIIVEICEVCYWQYDESTLEPKYQDISIGPNKVSLNEARKNYSKFGACEKRFIGLVRPPTEKEKKLCTDAL